MMSESQNVVVILTAGKADNGKHATLAFACALSALAMGDVAAIFLTGDGAIWGFKGSSEGMVVQGFAPLSELIQNYLDDGGRLILCSVCHRTCGRGGPGGEPAVERLANVEIGGFATMLELAKSGVCITF